MKQTFKQPPPRRTAAPRYTYSKQNADTFRHIYDGMTDTKDRFISSDGAKLTTLHIKLSDALRWLAQEEGGKYAKLKSKVVFRKLPTGILIKHVNKDSIKPFTVTKVSREDWISDLMAWILNAESDEIWERGDVVVTRYQQDILQGLKMEYPEMEYVVEGTTVRVIR